MISVTRILYLAKYIMFKKIKNWFKSIDEAQTELNRLRIYTAYHSWGAYVTCIDPKLTKHINTKHDRSESVQTENTKSKS